MRVAFVEKNENEGETWVFVSNMKKEEYEYLKQALENPEFYPFSIQPTSLTKETIEELNSLLDSGYMYPFNECELSQEAFTMFMQDEGKNSERFQTLYKGGLFNKK